MRLPLALMLAAAILLILAPGPARAAVLNCNSCSTCSAQIQAAASGDTVQLTAWVTNYAGGTCVDFGGKDNVTFDCLGNWIDGDDLGVDYGIWLNPAAGGSNNNTIRNCVISDFYYGIYGQGPSSGTRLDMITALSNGNSGIYFNTGASNNTLTNVNSNGNTGSGLYMSGSNYNNITGGSFGGNAIGIQLSDAANNTINTATCQENTQNDVYFGSVSGDVHCSNNITGVTGSGGRPIGFYNYTVSLQDQLFSELILCNADNSQLTNVNVSGSNSISNNGLYLYRTDKATLSRINSSNNYYGLYLSACSNNTISDATLMENMPYDFYVVAGTDLQCSNSITAITGSAGRPVMYYNYSVNLQNQIFSELVLCKADWLNATNVSIMGSSSLNNNGIIMLRTNYTNFTRINSSYNYNGFSLSASSRNTLSNITAYRNQVYGIYTTASTSNIMTDLDTGFNSIPLYSVDGIRLDSGSNSNILDRVNASYNTGSGFTSSSSSNNTITNVTANSNGYYGTYLYLGANNTVRNATVNSNGYYGINLYSSSNNTLANVTAMENTRWDVYVSATTDVNCNNNLTNITSTGGRMVIYYNYSATVQNQVFSELVLCNADYSNVTNVTIIGSTAKKNNGVLMVRTDYTNLTQMNSSYRYYGFYLTTSSFNILRNVTARYSSLDGIYITNSTNNTITDAVATSNALMGVRLDTGSSYTMLDRVNASYNSQSGVSIISGSNNALVNSTTSYNGQSGVSVSASTGTVITNVTSVANTQYGIYLLSSSFSVISNVTASSNLIHGVYLFSSSSNMFSNVTASSNQQYGFFLYASSRNNISGSAAENNRVFDINVTALTTGDCDNYMQTAVSSGGRPIGFYNSTVNLQNQVFSELILCDADNSQLRNITIAGSDTVKNNGIVLIRTDYATLRDINSSYRYNGIFLSSSTHNTFINVTSIYNSQSGFYLLASDYNNLTGVSASYNSQGIYLMGSQHNAVNDSMIGSNSNSGVYLDTTAQAPFYSSYNTFYNNVFTSSKPGPGAGNFLSTNLNNSNYWNITNRTGPNIMFTSYIGGNYWGSSDHKAPSDLCVDVNKNGYCDAPYATLSLDANNTDSLVITSDKGPPDIWFVQPTPPNASLVNSNFIEVNVSLSEAGGTCLLNWYDGIWSNYTMALSPDRLSCYLNMTDLSNFQYAFRVFANDTWGNMNVSEDRQNRVTYIGPLFILAKFGVDTLHIELGENRIVRVYVQNPDPMFANVTVWLGGDYPAGLAVFSNQTAPKDAYFTADLRNVTVGLNPKNQLMLNILVMSTNPRSTPYIITLNASTTGSGKKDYDTLANFVDYPASFPGLEPWSIFALVACAGLIFWIRKRD